MTKRHRNSLYFVVKEQIMKDIQLGVYKVGDRIPTESELCEQFQVSRTTVRFALQELESEGILERIQGKGTFIKRKELQLLPTRSFAEDILSQGKVPGNKIIEASVIPAESPLDEFLQIPTNSPITRIIRVRYADEEPLIYERTFIPWSLAPGLSNDNWDGSLFTHLKTKYKLSIHRSVENIKPVLADKTASKLLNIKEGMPCLQVKTFTYLIDQTPLEYNFGIFRGDFPNYRVERIFE
ncbi:GntR family transcriptional regulator [Paenibacillus sp. SYP-B3998]|uniref:GntR family transcriptional regulator n=1 Tax=Paenibacillus sp. SYP-B3998 TaxID=2678564 RepID=A0A6G3ZYW7_9BACL|nr:GntR family transcriptional regulator [Paenibacillus sp. SYP-B3998]NEW06597.1 GntR family transcriptional regulator [Paenibacillus sp. SYP-B3998]